MSLTANALVMRIGARLCAVPLAHVAETMRPLAIHVIAGAPPYVRGLAVVRGVPTPVIDVAALLGSAANGISRFVTVRSGPRIVALAVDAVIGVRGLVTSQLAALPSLATGASSAVIESIGTLDAQLLIVLRAARLFSDDVARSIAEVAR